MHKPLPTTSNPIMKQVFIVEDDPDIRELIEFLLKRRKYKVESFSTAKGFRAGIRLSKPDLILLDIMLPDGNGLDLCRDLNTNIETCDIPVVLMSAHTAIDISEEMCARDFIQKPFDVSDFSSRVHKQLA